MSSSAIATRTRPPPMKPWAGQARRQPPGDRRHEEGQQREREEAQARLQRRVAQPVLEVEREVEEHREHRRRRARRRRARRPPNERLAEQARGRASAPRCARSTTTKADEQDRGAGEEPGRSAGCPSPRRCRARARRSAGTAPPENVTSPTQSIARGVRVAGLARPCVRRHAIGGDADRDVDEEDRLPADALGQHAADERADGDGGARWSRPRSRTRCRARGPGRRTRGARARWRTSPRRRCPAGRGRG